MQITPRTQQGNLPAEKVSPNNFSHASSTDPIVSEADPGEPEKSESGGETPEQADNPQIERQIRSQHHRYQFRPLIFSPPRFV